MSSAYELEQSQTRQWWHFNVTPQNEYTPTQPNAWMKERLECYQTKG